MWVELAKILAIAYLSVIVVMLFLETSLVYPAPRANEGDWQADSYRADDAWMVSSDGTRIHGWYFSADNAKRTILMCHGNGENVADVAPEAEYWRDRFGAAVLVFDYRGYGKSDGSPCEAGVLADAEAAQTWLADRRRIPKESIVLYGRSLGGGVAVHLAATQGAAALILDRTFSSLVDVAAHHFRWLPVRWLMRNRYPSIDRIAKYHGPLLQLHGEADGIVPWQLAKRLFDASSTGCSPRIFVLIPGLQHNDPIPEEFLRQMADLMDTN